MIDTSPASGSRSLPSSSSSAVVASRPAKTPKLIRISRPAGSCSTANAMASSTCIETRITGSAVCLTLARFPAELPHGYDDSEHSPAGEHGHVGALLPDLMAVQIDGIDRVEQVFQRQHVTDRAQDARVLARRPERAGQEGH